MSPDLGHHLLQPGTPNIAVRKTHNSEPQPLEQCVPFEVVVPLCGQFVNRPIDFEHEVQVPTVEIDDEPVDDLLSTEPDTMDTTVPQQRPSLLLSHRSSPTQLPRDCCLLPASALR